MRCETVKKMTPTPRAMWRGQKVKYIYISITKSSSKVFIPNYLVILQIKDESYRMRFLLLRLVHVQKVGLGGAGVPRRSSFIF